MKISAALACLAVGLMGLANTANAAPISWAIVSSASTISLAIPNQTLTITSSSAIASPLVGTSMSISMRALNPGTGSASTPTGWTIGNKENVSGTLQTDTDFQSFIKFLNVQDLPNLSPTLIDGIDSGSYAPLANGDPGTALGDFGTRIFAGQLLGNMNLDFAFRNMLYDLTSGVIGTSGSLNNHTFAASSTFFGVENADLAFRARNGGGLAGGSFVGLVGSGSANIGGFGTNNTAGAGSIVVTPQPGGDLATLTIPITQTLLIPLDSDGLLVFKLNVTGTIVATAIVPEPATMGMLAFGMAMLVPVAVRRWRKRA